MKHLWGQGIIGFCLTCLLVFPLPGDGKGPAAVSISPSFTARGGAVSFQIEGQGADSITSASLAFGGETFEMVPPKDSARETALKGNLLQAASALYDLTLYSDGQKIGDVPHAVEITSPPLVPVGGVEETTMERPFYRLRDNRTEILLRKEDIRLAGTIHRIGFELLDPLPEGEITLRVQETGLEALETDQLTGGDWTTLLNQSISAPAGPLVLNLQFAYDYTGEQNLLLDVIWQTGELTAPPRVAAFSDEPSRCRWGGDVILNSDPESWQGDQPANRSLLPATPVVTVYFLGQALTANFTASATTIRAGESVIFTDITMGNVIGREWDFDGDGVIDGSSAQSGFKYQRAGTYPVMLRTRARGAEDSQTTFIEVLPAFTSGSLWSVE